MNAYVIQNPYAFGFKSMSKTNLYSNRSKVELQHTQRFLIFIMSSKIPFSFTIYHTNIELSQRPFIPQNGENILQIEKASLAQGKSLREKKFAGAKITTERILELEWPLINKFFDVLIYQPITIIYEWFENSFPVTILSMCISGSYILSLFEALRTSI